MCSIVDTGLSKYIEVYARDAHISSCTYGVLPPNAVSATRGTGSFGRSICVCSRMWVSYVELLCGAQQHPRGCSSVGRALRSHRRGRGFDYHQLHEGRCIHSTAAAFFFFSSRRNGAITDTAWSRQPSAPSASGQLSTQAAVRVDKDSGHTFWPGAKARPSSFEPMKPYAPQDLRHDSRHTFWPMTRDFGRL